MRLQAWSSRRARLLMGLLIVSFFAGERLLRAYQSETAPGFSSAALFASKWCGQAMFRSLMPMW
jgi:hypothetical protein